MSEKVVLAYSGGLDTSVAIHWLTRERGYEVIALTVDVGMDREREVLEGRALAAGATRFLWHDARDSFIREFAFPALAADALYEGRYPLATALSRPLIAQQMAKVARQEGATAVGHGCTGKGNDQVRFDVAAHALAPDLHIVAPVREWGMDREGEIAYARRNSIPVEVSSDNPYSVDENLWGRSIECGVLEDPWREPPEEIYGWTCSVEAAPRAPRYMEVAFAQGVPVALDGYEVGPVDLVRALNEAAGEHGVGRIDMVENRLVGFKSREIYEAPAAVVLLAAHEALEQLTLSKEQLRMKAEIAAKYAELIYNGLWFTPHQEDLAAYVKSSQRSVSGTVRLRLHKGQVVVAGRKSPRSLYDMSTATYDEADKFDQSAAKGFIHIWGLPVRIQAQNQRQERD